ncbi:MAG TPA: sulfatase-like hydrolase/transferase, partial [Gemmata sp.]
MWGATTRHRRLPLRTRTGSRKRARFTDAQAPPAACTPTRYTLPTGRYTWRTRLQRNAIGPFAEPLITEKQLTLAELLRRHGYVTACVGKWHLGWGWP